MKLAGKIFKGDAYKVLGRFPVESVDCVMTSPPYWALRDYKTKGQLGMEKTIAEYIKNLCDIFDRVRWVLKKTGTCWVNIGDTFYGGGRNKGNTSKKKIYKQHTQPGSFVHKEWGDELPERCLCQIPHRFAIEMVNRGWILRNTIIWQKPNVMPSSAKNRFTVDFEYLFFFTKNKKYFFNQQIEDFQSNQYDRARMPRARTEYGRKWAQESGGAIKQQRAFVAGGQKGRNMRTVWSISTRPYGGAHYATYPLELCLTPIRAGCPAGGLVLDPFLGAGTTAVAAKALGREYCGIELSADYIYLAKERLAQDNLKI